MLGRTFLKDTLEHIILNTTYFKGNESHIIYSLAGSYFL